jgi:hypothetical protein
MNWYELTKKYNNLKYKAGSLNVEQGLDCLTLLFSFYEDMGIDLSKLKKSYFSVDGKKYTIKNYTKLEPDVNKRNKIFKAFLSKFFKKVKDLKKGDLVLFEFMNHEIHGISAGKNLLLCAIEGYGVRNIKIKKSGIQEVYRWQSCL